MAEGRFVTEDMTLVAVLRIEGINHDEMEENNGGCRWVFTGEIVSSILDILRTYNDDAFDVEPREFTRKLGLVRQEMYSFLGVKAARVRSAT